MVDYLWQDAAGIKQLYGDGHDLGSIAPFTHDGIQAEDEIVTLDEGIFRWTRKFRLTGSPPAEPVRLTMDFVANRASEYAMIPGVSYNGNPWGTGQDPKGFVRDGTPWSFAYHRTSVPGATFSQDRAWSAALFGKEVDLPEAGFSCSLIPEETRTIHRLIWPEEERPFSYIARNQYDLSYARKLSLNRGDDFVTTAYLVVAPVAPPQKAWRRFLDVAWEMNHHRVEPWFSPERIWELGIRFAKESLWAEEGIFRGFSIGLWWENDTWRQRPVIKYEIGWAGQNATLANILLHDYLRTGDTSSLQQGISTLDTWTTHAPLSNGMIRGRFDPILSSTDGENEVQDACNLGVAASRLFDSFQIAQRCGVDRPIYQEVALGVCDFAVRVQQENGQFGKAWLNDGTCVDPNGTIGSFLIPALLKAHNATGKAKYLKAAKKAYAAYIAGLLNDGYTTAGALDTHCIDKESAYPLLEAGLALYATTQEKVYLRGAELAAEYVATWQWHHTVPYPERTALHSLNYDTFGGTSVSAQHQHQDPFATAWVVDLLQLAELTGYAGWRQRALAGWANGTIGISDGNLEVMGKRRPAGSQDEGFFHTRWGDVYDVSQWLVSWPTAFRLETLRRLEDWSILA